jgi:hypothetical protein
VRPPLAPVVARLDDLAGGVAGAGAFALGAAALSVGGLACVAFVDAGPG